MWLHWNLKSPSFSPFEFYGLGYERLLGKHISLHLSYAKWHQGELPSSILSKSSRVSGMVYEPCFKDGWENCLNKVFSRRNYEFLDMGVNYKVFKIFNKFNLAGGLAFSRAWGEDIKLDTIVPSVFPWHGDFLEYSFDLNAVHYGLVPMLSFEYPLWKGRFVPSFHFRTRKYFGLQSIQSELGLQCAFHF